MELSVHDVSEAAKHCLACGKAFASFPGAEASDMIAIRVQAHMRRIQRPRDHKTCQCPQVPGIVTAPLVPRVIQKSLWGVSVWTMVLLGTYLYGSPTRRPSRPREGRTGRSRHLRMPDPPRRLTPTQTDGSMAISQCRQTGVRSVCPPDRGRAPSSDRSAWPYHSRRNDDTVFRCWLLGMGLPNIYTHETIIYCIAKKNRSPPQAVL